MGDCAVFNKSLVLDANLDAANISIDISKIRSLIGDYETETSGLWQPIIISTSQSSAIYCEPLIMAGLGTASSFSPCNCSDAGLNNVTDSQFEDFQDSSLSCNYCGDSSVESWNLVDANGEKSSDLKAGGCCSGACDIRMKKDDYIPKIPVLNHSYISGFLDFKYMSEFPACTNAGLGFEKFITIPENNISSIAGADLCIDWKIKDTISEIPYNKIYTQHDSENLHNKSFNKAGLKSHTCGNFILTKLNTDYETEYKTLFSKLSGLIGSDDQDKRINIPSVSSFQETPYGFDKQTYNNIYINNDRIGSYWKWNYTSGIMGWYRYFETNRTNDQRPIRGVDLYISPGDVFFATNDGPEPEPDVGDGGNFIKECPSGLKIVDNNEVSCIIPSGSEFMYISANIYPQFFNIYNTLLFINGGDSIKTLNQAALLATAPAYDKVTVDLHKSSFLTDYQYNALQQIDVFNRNMLVTTKYDSVSNLYYISNKKELIHTLVNKYGAYLWIPPNSSQDIIFTIPTQTDSFYVDIDFDLAIKKNDTKFRNTNCREIRSCGTKNYNKHFYYNQTIALGTTSLSTACFDELRHKQTCAVENDTAIVTKYDFNNYSTLYLNNSRIKSVPSSATCIKFEDSYPRIVNSEDPLNFCYDCDENSSFYLVPDAEIDLCRDGDFCFTELAKRFNNSENPTGDRKERYISDDTLRMKRSYSALAFNPYIDIIAFHKDNGIFFRSRSFGNKDGLTVFDRLNSNITPGNPKLSFVTKDIGLKIYGLYAEKLQSSSTSSWSCKRFPVDLNACKCYGLNISDYSAHPYNCDGNTYGYADVFLPGLSTKNSPTLRKYGGYSQSELDSLFGQGVLTAGGSLPRLTNKIIPDQPYGCERSISISLKNYVNSEWVINPKEFSTEHSDVFISVSENGDPSAFYASYVYDGFYFTARNNPTWKRFFTRVNVTPSGAGSSSSNAIWKDQILNFFPKGSTIPTALSVYLQNPYLEKLTKDQEYVLAPPSGDLVSGQDYIFGQPVSYGDPGVTSRGDETVTVSLNFVNKPRKQILTFGIDPPRIQGTLQKGFFHPNSGLTTDSTYHGLSPIKNNKIYYDQPLYNDFYDEGVVLVGDIDESIKNLFNNISQFDRHRKPRLYLQINGSWYNAIIPNRYGYKHQNYTFVGRPSWFEYVHHKTDSLNIPGFIPVSPKQHVPLNFISNHTTKLDFSTYAISPILFDKFEVSNDKTIILPGSRYYFMVPEIDPSISIQIASLDDISTMSEADQNKITFGSMVQFGDGRRWVYRGPNKTSPESYVATDYNYLYHNFSDLHIPYSATNKAGYVYNSKKNVSRKIALYNSRGELDTNIVLKKELLVKFDKSVSSFFTGNEATQIQVYTKFLLQNKVRRGYNMIDPLLLFLEAEDEDTIKQYSLTVYVPTLWLRSESDTYLSSPQKTKWGDVLYYDGEILDDLTSVNIDASYWYPTPSYENTFYKLIVNNHLQNQHRYQIFVSNNSTIYTIDHNDLVYYNIHQKYNTDYSDKFYSTNLENYHNYLPFMDINLLSTTSSSPIVSSLNSLIKSSNKPISGTIKTTSLYNELPDDYEWGSFIDPNASSDRKFWINLPSDTELVSAFIPTQIVYSTTLRIDDPIYWLNKTNKTSIIDAEESVDCYRTFNPSSRINTLSSTSNSFLPSNMGSTTEIRKQVFYSHPIYCDIDDPTRCGQQPCEIKNIGSVNLTSEFKIAKNRTLLLRSVSDGIPYIISYDAGNYNSFGTKSVTTIKRFEIEPDSWLDSTNSCSADMLRPLNLRFSTIDSRFQNNLTTVDDHPLLIKQTDDMANEILFRIMYGEKIPINKDILLQENKTLTIRDLLSYSEPKITAKDIYDQILYNYDRSIIPNNLIYSSTLSIDGILSVGKNINISIGSVIIDLTIVREETDTETIIALQGTFNNRPIYGKIYTEKYQENSLIVTENNSSAPQPSSDNETIIKVGSRTTRATYSWGAFASAVKAGGNWPGPTDNSCEDVSVTTGQTWTPGNYEATMIFPPSIQYQPRTSVSRCTANFDECQDFQYAYCRRNRKSECASCKESLVETQGDDFQYDFSACRNNFTLYGHTYRENHFDPIAPVTEVIGTSETFGYDCGFPASPGIARGCWGPRACPRCSYLIVDVFGKCEGCGAYCGNYIPGGPWTETCVIRKCLSRPATVKNIYHRKTLKEFDSYNPLCPTNLCTITYNNYAVTITYPDTRIVMRRPSAYDPATISQEGTASNCAIVDFNGACPHITINSLPSDFVIQESISSECSPCNKPPLKIDIPEQKQTYATIKEKRKCIIGTFVYGVINPNPLIGIGVTNESEEGTCHNTCCFGTDSSPPCYGAGSSLSKQCAAGFQWFACLGSMSYSQSTPTEVPVDRWFQGGCGGQPAGEGTHRPLGQMICEFGVPAMVEGPTAIEQLNEWKASIDESYFQGGCLENVHIPEADIIHGIVPGSCSSIPQYKTYSFKSFKARPVGKTGVEVAEWYVNVVVAYYEYEYIRPKTIQDVLKPEGTVCAGARTVNPDGDIPDLTLPETPPDGGGWDFVGQINRAGQFQCWSLGFPSWFTLPGWGDWWGWGAFFYPMPPRIPATFVLTDNYIKDNGCTDGVSSYYRYNLNRLDPNWQEPPMPCAAADWYCWSTQDMRSQFLSAKTGKVWV